MSVSNGITFKSPKKCQNTVFSGFFVLNLSISFHYNDGEAYYPLVVKWTKIGNVSYLNCSTGYTGHDTLVYKHSLNFDNNIVLGAAYASDGTILQRYAIGQIDYIRIKRI